MKTLTTFEDIFNRLIKEYGGKKVLITTGQQGLNLANFQASIDKIIIKPLNKKQSQKWTNSKQKVGLIILQEKRNNNYTSVLKIPFILGFYTMKAVFSKKGVTIKTMDLDFNIKKYALSRKKGA